MKYLPLINIWAKGIQEAILCNQLKLQRGQWCICGLSNNKPCRYISHTKHSIWVIHWQGTSTATTRKFINICRT